MAGGAAGRGRLRQDETRRELGRAPAPPPTAPAAQVCATVALGYVAYPSSAGRRFWVRPLRESGPEVEGGAVAYADRAPPFQAVHVGATAPPAGTRVIVTYAERVGWAFDY